MSWQPCDEPKEEQPLQADAVDLAIVPQLRDLGGFQVRRVLPSPHRRAVGPFVFFDQAGPTTFPPGSGIDVRPHPHIGLATVTYLFAGEILHRDSLGSVQPIRPGAVNWMTAGRGIVHSERTSPEVRASGGPLFGIQAWVALPTADAEMAPAFVHHPAESLPVIEREGAVIRLIAGTLFGHTSPVETASPTLYAEIRLAAGARLEVPVAAAERALYPVDAPLVVDGRRWAEAEMLVLREGAAPVISADAPVRVMLLGGAPLDGPRIVWWNLVAGSRARIEQAKADWQAGRFPAVPGDDEFIPLPDA